MKLRKHPHTALPAMTAAAMLAAVSPANSQTPAAQSEPANRASVGTVVGVVLDPRKTTVARATVTATAADGSTIRGAISNSEGVYSFADLSPGKWTVSVDADGYGSSGSASIAVVPDKVTRFDIVVGSPATRGSDAVAAQSPRPAAATGAKSGAVSATGGGGDSAWKQLTRLVALVTQPAQAQIRQAQASPPPMTQQQVAATAKAAAQEVVQTTVPEALQAPDPAPANDTVTPLANVGDIGWMNGNTRNQTPIFDTKFFTPEVRFDVNYIQSTTQPKDHTIVGSTEEFRSGEFQIEQVSFGGNFHWHNVQARFLSMFGNFSTATVRNDASAGVGQWDLPGAYKYFSEANAGYHIDGVGHGLNIDAGIFVSYIGLFSYYNFDNWTYQPSFVSSNTPWFFNGLRIQYWPTQNLKIEPWLINGWQSYAKFNSHPGFGGQILWIPSNNLKLVFNSYGIGEDNLASGNGQPANGGDPLALVGQPNPNAPNIDYRRVHRFHEDDSLLYKYFDTKDSEGRSAAGISKAAFSLTWDFGCEYGGGVNCLHGPNMANFLGVMGYNRIWFDHDTFAVTVGGGFMNNPGRYLTLLPPINGATAATGSPYFAENPGQKIFQWDTQLNLQYMPSPWITWWTEVTFRHSNVPYWGGSGGVTPPLGNTGSPTSLVCNNGSNIGGDNCATEGGVWNPDLRTKEIVWGLGVMVKF